MNAAEIFICLSFSLISLLYSSFDNLETEVANNLLIIVIINLITFFIVDCLSTFAYIVAIAITSWLY